MKVLLPLEKMSLADKISTMEVIWENLSQNEATFSSPAWHKDILNERENNLGIGKEKILDWESIKKEYQKKIKMNIRILESASKDLIQGYWFLYIQF